jgi:Protein of unknown function (DUF2726)
MSLVATSEHPLALIVFMTALLILLGLGWSWAAGGTRTKSSWFDKLFGPKLLVRRKRFLSQVESETLRHLETLFPELRIHAQVAMSALIAPAKTLSPKERLWTHRRYVQKVVDFVLQDRRTGQVLVLVELDDWTHNGLRITPGIATPQQVVTGQCGCPRTNGRRARRLPQPSHRWSERDDNKTYERIARDEVQGRNIGMYRSTAGTVRGDSEG